MLFKIFGCLLFATLNLKAENVNTINIVYSIDGYSARYFFLSISSVISTISPSYPLDRIHFSIIACGSSSEEAILLAGNISQEIKCLNIPNILVTNFVHPISSSLRLSSFASATQPHWFADTETVRLLIPDIFPKLKRYIYLDNDTILTKNKSIEQLWKFDLGNHSVGLVLNKDYQIDVNHILNTYFRRDNIILQKLFPPSSSSFILSDSTFSSKTMKHKPINKLSQSSSSVINTKNQLSYKLSYEDYLNRTPKFPNNGVMLVDAVKWRENNITKQIFELADDNVKHRFMAMGSQPYTLIALRNHWTELPQYANLRGTGSMSARSVFLRHRGRGIVHFAGASKPHQKCFIDSRFMGMQSYRAMEQVVFLNRVQIFHNICPKNHHQFGTNCLSMKSRVGEWCMTYNGSSLPEWVLNMSKKCRLRIKYLKALKRPVSTSEGMLT